MTTPASSATGAAPPSPPVVRPPAARAAGVAVYLLFGLIVVALVWAAVAQIDVRVSARGRLVNPAPNIVVRPLEAGMLRSVAVRPGQIVRAGQLIATLDPTFASADLSQLSVRELTLRAQVERLRRQAGDAQPAAAGALGQVADQQAVLVDRRAAHAAKLLAFDERIERLRAARESTQADRKILAQRVVALEKLEAIHDTLSKENFGSQARLLEARERRLEVQRDLTVAEGRQAEIERDVRIAQAERASFAAESRQQVREELAQVSRESLEAREQLVKAQRRSDLVLLRAPQDAVVLEVRQTSPGSVVAPTEVLAVLVPLGGALLAEVDMASADIGEVRVGDLTRLKIDAFPFQRFGIVEGRVETISRDAFAPTGNEPGAGSVSYRIRVPLDPVAAARTTPGMELLPGMTLTGEVVVGRRTVLSYFLYPLIRTLDEAIRER